MGIWRASVVGERTGVGGLMYNSWHFRTDGDEAPGEDAAQALANFYDDISPRWPAAVQWRHDGLWLEVNEKIAVETTPWLESGTIGLAQYAPAGVAVIASWRTEIRSRSGRGRTFLGGVDQTQLQGNGTPADEIRQLVVTAGETLIDTFSGVGGAGGAFGVYSPTDGVIRDFTSVQSPDYFGHLSTRRT